MTFRRTSVDMRKYTPVLIKDLQFRDLGISVLCSCSQSLGDTEGRPLFFSFHSTFCVSTSTAKTGN